MEGPQDNQSVLVLIIIYIAIYPLHRLPMWFWKAKLQCGQVYHPR
jgi:hypothetical protein